MHHLIFFSTSPFLLSYPHSYSIDTKRPLTQTLSHKGRRNSSSPFIPLCEGDWGGCGTQFKEFHIRKRFFRGTSAHFFQWSKIRAYYRFLLFVINKATIIRAELYASYASGLAVWHTRNWWRNWQCNATSPTAYSTIQVISPLNTQVLSEHHEAGKLV